MEREKDEGRPDHDKPQEDPSRRGYGQQTQSQEQEQPGIGESGDLGGEDETMGQAGEDVQGRDAGSTEGRGGKRSPTSKSPNEGGADVENDKEDLP